MNHYFILVSLSVLIIISYFIGIISRKINIPSVLLLISAGMLSKYLLTKFGIDIKLSFTSLQLAGTLGIILIVMEGSLDLNVRKENMNRIISCLLFSVMMIIILSVTIGIVISKYFSQPILASLISAVPLSIVSSAIVIPSISMLKRTSQEFLIYNSIFSDISGVIIFNFLIFFNMRIYAHIVGFLVSFILTLALSVLFSILLTFILSNFKQGNEIIFILSSVILLYTIGKLFHLSSLILVFIFGLMLSNFYGINKKLNLVSGDLNMMTKRLSEFRLIISQFSFIIRTIFFFIFGLSIEIKYLGSRDVLLVGAMCLLLIYILRYILLKSLFSSSSLVQIFIAPRGLITILLFYTIPHKYIIKNFNIGNVLFLIILTNIIMIFGLLFDSEKA